MQNDSFIQKLLNQGLHQLDKDALIIKKGSSYEKIGFKEFWNDVLQIAHDLKQKGISKGDRVLVFVPMSVALYKTIVALYYIGAPAAFLDAWSTRNRMDIACSILKPKAFIGSFMTSVLLRLVSRTIRRIPLKLIARENLKTRVTFEEFKPAVVSKQDEALVAFTTGSTGTPKAANRTVEFIWETTQVLSRQVNPNDQSVDMPTLPLFVLINIATGVTSVIPDFNPAKPADINAAAIVKQINECKVTSSLGSPAFYDRLADYCLETGAKVCLKDIFLGGAPVFPPQARKLNKAFPDTRITVVYGSTEAEPISHIDSRVLAESDILNGLPVGHKVDEIELKLIQSTDSPVVLKENESLSAYEVKPGEVGEIVVAGKHVLSSYINSPEAFRENKIDEGGKIWHRTGDAGMLSEDGNILLFGRVKNRFMYNGRYVYTLPLEQKLLELEAVNFSVVLMAAGKLYVLLELKKANEGQEEAVRKEALNLLGGIKPDEVLFLPQIPRDPRHHSKPNFELIHKMLNEAN